MSSPPTPIRSLGLSDVVGLGVNCVVGSGVFLLPGLAAENLGPASLLAVLGAGILAGLIALCFAEVGSRFNSSGGAYVYSRAAFGDFLGFEVGWIATLAGILAWGALVNGFTVALAYFLPSADEGFTRAVLILGFVAVLGTVNLRGARLGARLSSVLTGLKLLLLFGFVIAGIFFIEKAHFTPFAPTGFAGFGDAVILFLYAYLGFENLVVPAGEMLDPRRSLPLALVLVMGTVTLLYLGVQAVAIGTLPELAGLDNAVAAAARAFLGEIGGAVVAAGVVISIIGVNAASSLILPRRLSALAEAGQLPSILGQVHPRFGTPWIAVLLIHAVVAAVALSGSFRSLVVIAVLARFLQYAPTCAAVLMLRRKDSGMNGETAAGFRLPLGPLIPLVALVLSGALLWVAEPRHVLIGLAAAAAGAPVYFLYARSVRQRG